jgi:uncharacterized protein (DUF488 family)
MNLGQMAISTGVIGIGYEGRSIDEFVQELRSVGVSRLADVRLNPISRKPGFSKTALTKALAEVGIAYDHYRNLGNPKVNRAGFSGTAQDLEAARAIYEARLQDPAATEAIEDLAAVGREQKVAVLCFEADQDRCHRDLVLSAVSQRAVSVLGNTRRAR